MEKAICMVNSFCRLRNFVNLKKKNKTASYFTTTTPKNKFIQE